MPEELERIKKSVWSRLKGKVNPRTKEKYTENDAWAIATTQYKESNKTYSVGFDEITDPVQIVSNIINNVEEQ